MAQEPCDGALMPEADALPQRPQEHRREGHDAEAAELDHQEDHQLSGRAEVGTGVEDREAGDTDRAHRGEERVHGPDVHPVGGGDGQLKGERSEAAHRRKRADEEAMRVAADERPERCLAGVGVGGERHQSGDRDEHPRERGAAAEERQEADDADDDSDGEGPQAAAMAGGYGPAPGEECRDHRRHEQAHGLEGSAVDRDREGPDPDRTVGATTGEERLVVLGLAVVALVPDQSGLNGGDTEDSIGERRQGGIHELGEPYVAAEAEGDEHPEGDEGRRPSPGDGGQEQR